MTMPKSGTRPITVDGLNYRFKVNKKVEADKEIVNIVIENSETGEIIKSRVESEFSISIEPSNINTIITKHNDKK